MIVFSYLGAPSNPGLDQRLYGLSGVKNVPGGLWVVLELEWSTSYGILQGSLNLPPISSSHFPLFLAYAEASFKPISIFPFFLAVVTVALPVFLLYFVCYEC